MKMRLFFFARERDAPKHTLDLPVASSKTNGIDPREAPFPALSSAWRYQRRHRKSVNCERIRVGPGAVSHFSYFAHPERATRAIFPEAADRRSLDDLSRIAPGTREAKYDFIPIPSMLSLPETKPISPFFCSVIARRNRYAVVVC